MLAAAPAWAQFVQQGGKLAGSGVVNPSIAGPVKGFSAAISRDGNTAIIGGPGDNGGVGAAWVFARSVSAQNNGVWSQQGGKLVGNGFVGAAQQGNSVAISADGNSAIVGGPSDNNGAGAAWIFTRSNGNWSQQGSKLMGGGSVNSAFQGQSVAISADGSTAIIGGWGDNIGVGAAWVFTLSSGVWSQQGNKLVGTGLGDMLGSWQGQSVAISGDGNTAIVGGPADKGFTGAVWVFTRSNGNWSQQGPKLAGTGAVGSAHQGQAVALSEDGNSAIEAGQFDNSTAGAAWIFTRTNGTWSQQGPKLVGSGASTTAEQGYAVSISGDGNTAIVGGGDDGPSGAAWIFTRSNGVWAQEGAKLAGSGAVNPSGQGAAVAISADGNTAVVGGPLDNGEMGAAWIFARQLPTVAPTVSSLAPAVSSGSSQSLIVTYNAPSGYETLDVLNVLINNVLDGRQACYLAYSRSSNVLYIVPDNGDGSQLTGTLMDGAGTLSNSQCTVTLNGSSASDTGNLFTLALNLTFTSSFGGNKVVYAAARDIAQDKSGWQTMGVHGVPPLPSTFPNPVSMSPSSGSSLAATITFTYQDQNTAANLQTVWALINTAIDGRAACYVAYYRPGNQLYLYPDNGDDAAATNIVLTGSNTISNSQCTVSAQGSQVETNGSTLNVTLAITFKPAFAGFKGVWLAAQTMGAAQTSAWQALGAEAVPGQ